MIISCLVVDYAPIRDRNLISHGETQVDLKPEMDRVI